MNKLLIIIAIIFITIAFFTSCKKTNAEANDIAVKIKNFTI
jgi:hypothetical protein